MPMIENVEVFWTHKCAVDGWERYEGKGPAKWSVQFRVGSQKEAQRLTKEFGFKFTPTEDNGGIVYKTSLARYAFKRNDKGVEDMTLPNAPVNVVLGNLQPVDPLTVGNGSVANISFFVSEDKKSRTLKGIQVMKLKVYEPKPRDDDFVATDDFEIIAAEKPLDDEIPF